MSVRSDLVKETIVDRMCQGVAARIRSDLPAGVAGALDQSEASAELARAGYFARLVETELFDAARSPMPGLADTLGSRLWDGALWPDAVRGIARDLASREPLERPAPDDADAVSWRVPGPGGHVRHYVALRLISDQPVALKRDFMYGFLIRCCEEAVPPPSG